MMPHTPEWLQVLASLGLVLVAAAVSRWQSLDLEKDLAVSSLRAFVQLTAIGYALEFVFAANQPGLILLIVAVMTGLAGWTSGGRAQGIPQAKSLALLSIGFGSWLTLGSLVLLGIFPFTAQMVIPVAGMVVGNAMNVNSLVMSRVRDELSSQRGSIEAALALGAPWYKAVAPHLKKALTAGMMPIIDSTKTVGLIQLPGAMTGIILAGGSPLKAVQLQMVVMYMLMGTAALTAFAAAWLASRAFFTPAEQLIEIQRPSAP